MKFGIELECGVEREKEDTIKKWAELNQVEFKGDGSVIVEDSELTPREIATKPYSIEEMPLVENIFKEFYNKYVEEINDSMGLHIHLSFDGIGDYNAIYGRRFISFFKRKLKKKYSGRTELIKRLTNRYCRGSYSKRYFFGSSDRYKMINYCAFSRHHTIEFRIFNAPKKSEEVIDYLLFTIETVQCYLLQHEYQMGGDVKLEPQEPLKINLNEELDAISITNIGGLNYVQSRFNN